VKTLDGGGSVPPPLSIGAHGILRATGTMPERVPALVQHTVVREQPEGAV